MAPDHPTKRTKVTDTRSSNSNNDDISPAVVASSSGVVESTPSVATATVDIKDILLSLSYDTKTQAQAIKNMESLDIFLSSKENCQELFDLQGISTILSVIHRFKKSVKLVEMASAELIGLTYHLPEASNVLIRLDFHKNLLSLANMHIDSIDVQMNAAILFQNMAVDSNPQLKVKLGTQEITHFMKNLMTTFPDNVKMVNSVCSYFHEMSNIPELKDRLLENEVAQPLVAAFQKFRKWKDDDNDSDEDDQKFVEEIVNWSKNAVANLFS